MTNENPLNINLKSYDSKQLNCFDTDYFSYAKLEKGEVMVIEKSLKLLRFWLLFSTIKNIC